MLILGVDYLATLLHEGFAAKMVFNGNGALIFPVTQEHCDQKAPGVSYADDYAGNALAAVLLPGKIEIRHHRDFSDARVVHILQTILTQPGLEPLQTWRATYHGRVLELQFWAKDYRHDVTKD